MPMVCKALQGIFSQCVCKIPAFFWHEQMIWLWNESEITLVGHASVVGSSSLLTFIHLLSVIQLNCLPGVRSYTALFAKWQIVDTYFHLPLMQI